MKKNSFETILYSVAGVAILLVIIIAFNAVTGTVRQRIDLTKEKAYTLSDGTKAILKKLDTPVKIRFYYSRGESGSPELVFLKNYAQEVQDLLTEYKQASHGKVILEQYDPEPDSQAEDSAQLDGIDGKLLPNGEKFYLGLSVSMVDSKEAIPFLDPTKEKLLEYDLSRAISRVVTPEKPVIGVMSPLPVFGMPMNPMMARMGQQQQGQEPWTFISELKADFNVKQVEMTADKIDDDIKVLVVIHPKQITDKAQYAIDQFVMRGGKLVAFLDATSVVDSHNQSGFGQMPGGGSSLDKLLKAWGLQFDTSKVAADLNYMNTRARISNNGDNPAWLSIHGDGINKDDIATSEIDDIWIPFGGVFTGTPVQGLKETVLLKTSKSSQLVDGMMANFSGENLIKEFKPSGTEYALAVRLTGKFKTAFPNGKPEEKKDDASAPDKKPEPTGDTLKETKGDNMVVLFGDADLIYDPFAFSQMNTPFGVIRSAYNGNLNLAQNVVEQLTGDDNLIYLRSRATLSRPFTRVNEMRAKAEQVYETKIKELEDSLQQTRQKLNELQKANNQSQQRFILSPEQQAEVDKFRKQEASVNVQLKEEKKKLTRDINSLENTLKWSNIIVMPAVVALSGVCLAVFKRKRTSAK